MARKDVQLIQLANQAADFFAFSASFLLGGATLFYLHGCCLAHTPNFQVKDLQFLSVLYVAVNIVFLSMGPMSPAKRLRSYSEAR